MAASAASLEENTIKALQRRVLKTYVKCEMTKYSQKQIGVQKKNSYQMEHHYLKKKVELVWESIEGIYVYVLRY